MTLWKDDQLLSNDARADVDIQRQCRDLSSAEAGKPSSWCRLTATLKLQGGDVDQQKFHLMGI